MGATHVVCAVISPIRPAGMLPMITVADPIEIIPGPAGTQGTIMHGADISVRRAEGIPLIRTVG